MEATQKRKPGPKGKSDEERAVGCTLTLKRRQKAQLEKMAEERKMTPSELIIKRLKLK